MTLVFTFKLFLWWHESHEVAYDNILRHNENLFCVSSKVLTWLSLSRCKSYCPWPYSSGFNIVNKIHWNFWFRYTMKLSVTVFLGLMLVMLAVSVSGTPKTYLIETADHSVIKLRILQRDNIWFDHWSK